MFKLIYDEANKNIYFGQNSCSQFWSVVRIVSESSGGCVELMSQGVRLRTLQFGFPLDCELTRVCQIGTLAAYVHFPLSVFFPRRRTCHCLPIVKVIIKIECIGPAQ